MCGDVKREGKEIVMVEQTEENLDLRFWTAKKELLDSIIDTVHEIIDLKKISCDIADKYGLSRSCVTEWSLDQLPTHVNDIEEMDDEDDEDEVIDENVEKVVVDVEDDDE